MPISLLREPRARHWEALSHCLLKRPPGLEKAQEQAYSNNSRFIKNRKLSSVKR